MLKLVGAVLILASATGLGISYSLDLKKRCMELRLLKQLVYLLRGELKYTRTPLPDAFGHMAERMREPFSAFLRSMERELGNLEGKTFGELWRGQIDRELAGTFLKKEDKEQLKTLGEVLGYLDLEMQLNSLDLYLEQLDLSILEAQEAIRTKRKLYQSLGVAGGIFLILLLL